MTTMIEQPLFPASVQQRQRWRHARRVLEGGAGDAGDWLALPLRVAGELREDALTAALRAVFRRHEACRLRAVTQAGLQDPVIAVDPEPRWIIHRRRLPEDAGVDGALRAMDAAALEDCHGCAHLFRESNDDTEPSVWLVVLQMPGWAVDIASGQLLADSLAEALAGRLGDDPDPAIQFSDYAGWQDSLASDDEDTERAQAAQYWSRQPWCESPPRLAVELNLPLERSARNTHSVTEPLAGPGDGLMPGLDTLAERWGVAPAFLVAAAWQCVVVAHTGRREHGLFMTLAERSVAELADTVGPVERALPAATTWVDDYRLPELAARLAAEHSEALTWAEYQPAALMPEALTGLPCVRFFAPRPRKAGETTLTPCLPHDSLPPASKYRLSLEHTGQALRAHLETAVLDVDVSRLLLQQCRAVLAAAVAEPDTVLADLELLRPQDAEDPAGWSGPSLSLGERHLLAAFDRVCRMQPDAPAVRYREHCLSYAELAGEVRQLAGHLRALGARAGTVVALVLDRGCDMPLAMLAAWRAGCAFLPMDPAWPPRHMATILADAEPVAVIASERHAERLAGSEIAADIPVTTIAACAEASAAASPEGPGPEATDLAYILYTSGSTGSPKGVQVEHRQLLNYTRAIGQRLALGAGRDYGWISSYATDLGYTMIFPALTGGGCVHVLDIACATDVNALAAYQRDHPLDYLKIVPSHLQALAAGGELPRLLPRRQLILGGERCPASLREQLAAATASEGDAPGLAVVNHYGPAETTIGVLCGPLAMSEGEPALGTPLANNLVFVLDERDRQVAPGCAGELCVAGANVARGYLNREDSAWQDYRDPVRGGWHRLYRTGDLVRRLPGGGLCFVGRRDHQVKVRGFRVEPGEIETVLEAHPAVEQAVVLPRPVGGDHQLHAYCTPAGEVDQRAADVEALRAHISERLPEHMRPATLQLLDRLPLLPNGKIDRRRLAARAEQQGSRTPHRAPETAADELMVRLWEEVLERERVGLDDDFFELGGQSLLGIKLLARVREQFRAELEPATLFEAATPGRLVACIMAAEPQPGLTEKVARTRLRIRAMSPQEKSQRLAADQGREQSAVTE